MMTHCTLLRAFRRSKCNYWHLRKQQVHHRSNVDPLKQFHVCIEGNIGCGKTTFLQHFRSLDNTMVIEEPLPLWREFEGHKPLETLYTDPKRWAFTFQSLVQLTLLKQHKTHQLERLRIMERSIFSARHCFIENLFQRGYLSDLEYKILDRWYHRCITEENILLDLIVYMRSSPETCLQRIKTRQRPEEQNVTLDYLKDLHELHETWLIKGDHSSYERSNVLVIDADKSMEEMAKMFQQTCLHIHHYQHTPDIDHETNPNVITVLS